MKLLEHVNQQGKIIGYMFFCPGCQENHSFNTETGTTRPTWSFNGNLEFPTFKPSLLIRSGCSMSGHKPEMGCWCTFEAKYGKPSPFKCGVCHLYVTDGKIQFLSDCTHELAGKTVDLQEID